MVFFTRTQFNKDSIKKIVDTLLNAGCQYNTWFLGGYSKKVNEKTDSYYEDMMDGDPSGIRLNNAIKSVADLKGGFIKLDFMLDEPADIMLHIYPNEHMNIYITTPGVYFRKCNDNFYKLLNLGKRIYYALSPIEGYADIDIDIIKRNSKISIYWGNFFTPQIVERIGRKKLVSSPAWRMENLEDGGILLILTSNPIIIEKAKAEVEKHLDLK